MSDEEQPQEQPPPPPHQQQITKKHLMYPKGEASVRYGYKMASICGMFVCLIVIVIASTTYGIWNKKYGNDWIGTTANITGIVPCGESNNQEEMYTPQVTFETYDNNQIITSTPKTTCSKTIGYSIGDPLDVVYNPENPSEVQTQIFVDSITITSVVFLSIGCFCCCLSSLVYFYLLGVKRPGVPENSITSLYAVVVLSPRQVNACVKYCWRY